MFSDCVISIDDLFGQILYFAHVLYLLRKKNHQQLINVVMDHDSNKSQHINISFVGYHKHTQKVDTSVVRGIVINVFKML